MVTITPAAPLNGPAVLPATLIDQYVKPADEQADLVSALRLTALGWVESHTGRSLARRNWIATFDGFGDDLYLPRGPVRSVVSLTYVDPAGAVVDGVGIWRLAGAQLVPAFGAQWPAAADRTASVQVTFQAGYDDVANEAPALRIAALMLVGHLLAGGSLADVPAAITLLIDEQYRTPVIG